MDLFGALLSVRAQTSGSGPIIPVEGSAVTIRPIAGNSYRCGTLRSLTVADAPAAGMYTITFFSGSEATSTVIPAEISGLESFAAAANTRYEINVSDGYALCHGWPMEEPANA